MEAYSKLLASVTQGFSASVEPGVMMGLDPHPPDLLKAFAFKSGTSWELGTSSLRLLPEEGYVLTQGGADGCTR